MGAAEGGAEGGESDGVVAMSFVFQLRVCDAHSIMIAVVHVVFSIFERAIVSQQGGWCRTVCRTVGLSDYCRTTVGNHCRTVGPGLSQTHAELSRVNMSTPCGSQHSYS